MDFILSITVFTTADTVMKEEGRILFQSIFMGLPVSSTHLESVLSFHTILVNSV